LATIVNRGFAAQDPPIRPGATLVGYALRQERYSAEEPLVSRGSWAFTSIRIWERCSNSLGRQQSTNRLGDADVREDGDVDLLAQRMHSGYRWLLVRLRRHSAGAAANFLRSSATSAHDLRPMEEK